MSQGSGNDLADLPAGVAVTRRHSFPHRFAVVIGSGDEARGRAAADQLRSEGVEAVRFDVTRAEDHRDIARHLEGRYGRLDVLVNNAGVQLEEADFGSSFNTTSTVTPDIFRRTLTARKLTSPSP